MSRADLPKTSPNRTLARFLWIAVIFLAFVGLGRSLLGEPSFC